MAVRTLVFFVIALLVGIAALVLHLLALRSPHWKITTRNIEPITTPVSYGIWERCEYNNVSVIRQGVATGTRTNVQFCYPNRYMRYSPSNYRICHSLRRRCSVANKDHLPKECSCQYLPSAKGLQWLTVLAAICLIVGLSLLYLRSIASPNNHNAAFILSYGPFICFLLTLLLMVTGLVLLGAYLRRDTYEDYSFPLSKSRKFSLTETFDLHSLRTYAKNLGENLSREEYIEAENELREDANTHYHTTIGRATIYEISATILIFLDTILTFWLGTKTKSEDY